MANFDDTVTAQTGWNNLLGLMQARGYTGQAALLSYSINNNSVVTLRVKVTNSALVPPAGGADGSTIGMGAVKALPYTSADEPYDAGLTWIYASAAASFDVSAASRG